MNSIAFLQIWKQIMADLIGKDSYRGVTLSYSWLANQFGHFGLGFIPTVFLFSYPYFKNTNAAIIVSSVWLAFEILNFTVPLLSNRPSLLKILPIPSLNKYVFKPDYYNVGFDTFTDVLFFGLGAFSANYILNQLIPNSLIVVIIFIMLTPCSYYWYTTKMYIQGAVYPFQLRLSQINNNKINSTEAKLVQNFVRKCLVSEGNNFIIYGSTNSGKTSLAVAMATELSIKHKICWYTSGMKILSKFSEDVGTIQGTENIWNWKDAQSLIIDDVDAGGKIVEELINPQLFNKYLESPDEKKKLLSQKNIIWVLGNIHLDDDLKRTWEVWITEIGINKKLSSIILNKIDEEANQVKKSV